MNQSAPFTPGDLAELDGLLSRAHAVIALREVHAGNRHPDVIGLRHDVDGVSKGALAALDTADKFARWEAERGYRASYYLLHTAPYWRDKPKLRRVAERIALQGHEIGIHANAVAHALRHGGDPNQILHDAIGELRSYGHPVRGVVGHGDSLCREARFANDEMFLECARPKDGAPDRVLSHDGRSVRLTPTPLSEFGLDYEAVRVGRGYTQSDSGGQWLFPFDQTLQQFQGALTGAAASHKHGQLHLLVHPDWWEEAF